jgi:hypothetical protein
MAGGYRRSGLVEALPDPFGSLLRSEFQNDRLVLWSVGGDGKDDGGSGDWKGEDQNKDLVLDVSR